MFISFYSRGRRRGFILVGECIRTPERRGRAIRGMRRQGHVMDSYKDIRIVVLSNGYNFERFRE